MRMKNKSQEHLYNHKRLWFTAIGVLLIDQLTKIWTQFTIPLFHAWEIIPSFLYWAHAQNSGAAWGIFKNSSYWLGILAILVLLGLFLCRHHLQLDRKGSQYAWGLMGGGIVGNMIDRFTYGHVVDFIDCYIGSYHWPTFNLADAAITIGTMSYFLCMQNNPTPIDE